MRLRVRVRVRVRREESEALTAQRAEMRTEEKQRQEPSELISMIAAHRAQE